MNRADKVSQIEFLTESLKRSQVAVCADYLGLDVARITALRRELKNAGCVAKVVRNTLAKISAKSIQTNRLDDVEKFVGTFEGPSFIVFSNTDPIAPTKILAKFAKENEKFRVKGAWLDGQFVDSDGVRQLSTMPGRLETLAMLLNLINAPATQLVRLMSEPATQVVRVADAQRKKLGGE